MQRNGVDHFYRMLPRMRNRTILAALDRRLVSGPGPSADSPLPPGPTGLSPPAGWTQWGGPHRNFMSDAKGLASTWPAGGPKTAVDPRPWRRALGDRRRRRPPLHDVPAARHAPWCGAARRKSSPRSTPRPATTIWEYKYPSPTAGIDFSEGAGPHSTPLVTADRVFAAGQPQGAVRAEQGERPGASGRTI